MKIKLTKKWKIVIGIIVIISLVTGYYLFSNQGVEVGYYTIDKGTVRDVVKTDGLIKSDEINTIYSLANGEILAMNFEIGQKIEQGDIIAEIDKTSIENQIKGVNAQINQLNYTLKELAEPADKEQINKLEIQVNSTQVQLNRAKETYEKNKQLYENGAISQTELEASEDQVEILENQISGLREDLSLVKKKVSRNVELQYQSQIDSLEAQKANLEQTLNHLTIESKYNGVITDKFVEEGQFVTQGQPVVEVSQRDKLTLLADVLESDVNLITEDTPVVIEDEIAGKEVEGAIDKIYPKIYEEISELGIKQNKVNVEVIPDGLSNRYLINQTLDVSFIIGQEDNVIRVPLESYYETDGYSYVFINEDGEAVSKEIKVGLEGEDYIEVVEGLEEGDEIIETLENEIEEGMKIK